MPRYKYTKAHRLAHLHDQILTAGIAAERVEGDGATVWVTVPDGVARAAVDAVVAAHDAAALDAAAAARQAADEDIRRQVFTAATAAVGKGIGTLTTAERNALIAVLLWRWGALTADLKVRPLEEWAYAVRAERAAGAP